MNYMWILFAFGSAFFAGLTSILIKCGIKKTDSDAATAIRTCVVLVFSWIMVLIAGSVGTITALTTRTWVFLILSGIATGASWLCYFKALQMGDINKVVPIDKSSTILTILLAFIFLGEEITWIKACAVVLIGTGTYLMIQKKETSADTQKSKNKAWLVVFVKGKQHTLREIPKNELGFIALSGLATGASWMCYYKALHDGMASVVVPIDKLSILVSIGFSYVVFKERLTKKAAFGLCLIVAGTLIMLI